MQRDFEIEHLTSEKERWKSLYMITRREQMAVARELSQCAPALSFVPLGRLP